MNTYGLLVHVEMSYHNHKVNDCVLLWMNAAFLPNEASRRKSRRLMLAKLVQKPGRQLRIFWGKTVIRLIPRWVMIPTVIYYYYYYYF